VDTGDRRVNAVAMSLTVYKHHLPYSGYRNLYKHYVTGSYSGLCDYCYFEHSSGMGFCVSG